EGVSGYTDVAQLTGKDSINKTDQYDVYGTDLGSMFNFNDKTYFVFGDTFGTRPENQIGAGGANWRSNAMAYTTDTDPSDGITFDGFVTYPEGKYAKELLSSPHINFTEMTKIPTGGIAVGDAMYLYFMSVNHWASNGTGTWKTNYSGVAKSVDEGVTWDVIEGL